MTLQIDRAEYVERFAFDPLGWVYWSFPGIVPEDWQAQCLHDVGERLKDGAHKAAHAVQVAASSGHGTGKSTVFGAWLPLWFLTTRPRARITLTANTATQLEAKTWTQLSYWYGKFPLRDWLDKTATKVVVRGHEDQWFIRAIPWSEHRPEALAGEHGDHVAMFMDEASAIPKPIWDTVHGAMTTGECLWGAAGNPTRATGEFVDCFNGPARHNWGHYKIDARTMKRPGVNTQIMNEWVDQHGEDSDFVRIRVRGEFPKSGFFQFIPQENIDAARSNTHDPYEYRGLPTILSMDVGAGGLGQTVAGLRQGSYLARPLFKSRERDLMKTAGNLIRLMEQHDPNQTVVDGNGVGKGVYDRCNSLGKCVINVWQAQSLYEAEKEKAKIAMKTVAGTTGKPMEFGNFRAWMWGKTRDWLPTADIPDDIELLSDLAAVEFYQDERTGLTMLESKKDMAARGVASPDSGDMLSMSLAIPPQAGRRLQQTVANTDFRVFA